MRNRALDVGIIGAGTAGSAAAVFLARAGHRVTLYERVANPMPVGAGITLQPSGQHVLCRLELYPYVVARGARIDRLLCESAARRSLIDLSYKAVGEDLFGVGLHRGVLFEALYGAVKKEGSRIDLHTGVEIVDLARADGGSGRAARPRDAAHGEGAAHESAHDAQHARRRRWLLGTNAPAPPAAARGCLMPDA